MKTRLLVLFLFLTLTSSAFAGWGNMSVQVLDVVPGVSGPQFVRIVGDYYTSYPGGRKIAGVGSLVTGGGKVAWISGPTTVVAGKHFFFVGGKVINTTYTTNLFKVTCTTATCSLQSVFTFPLTQSVEDGWVQTGPISGSGASFGLISQDKNKCPMKVWVATIVPQTGVVTLRKVGTNIPKTVAIGGQTISTCGAREIYARGVSDTIIMLPRGEKDPPVYLRFSSGYWVGNW